MRSSDFEFDGFHLLYYDFNKISLNRVGSYIEFAKWIKNKKSKDNRIRIIIINAFNIP